jgi:hypothetical protein
MTYCLLKCITMVFEELSITGLKAIYLIENNIVVYSNVCSDISCRKFGVPQGSVLGPLLFLIYVNDVGNAVPDANVKLFVDDTNLFIVDPDVVTLNKKANCFIDQLQQWFIANKLSINITKTCCMVFPSKNQNKIQIVIHNLEVQKVTSCKYLA